MLKAIVELTIIFSLGAAGIAEAVPEAVVKMPYSVPSGAGNVYSVFDKPSDLGMCIGIKNWQALKGESHPDV